MIIRELTETEARKMLRESGLADHAKALPYRGYAVTLSDNGKRRRFIGHSPDGRYILQDVKSDTQPA